MEFNHVNNNRIVPDMTLNKMTAIAERGRAVAGERFRPF